MEWLANLGYGLGTFFLVIGIVILILGKFSNSVVTTYSNSTLNEFPTYINSTGYTLLNSGAEGFSSPSITSAVNASSGLPIASANYTVSSTGVVTNSTPVYWNNVTLNYTYSYKEGTNTSNSINYGITQLGSSGLLGWAPAIVAIVIGVFFLSYFMGNSGGKRYR